MLLNFIFTFLLIWVQNTVFSQQKIQVLQPRGGALIFEIPNIIDEDQDGLDDELEKILLEKFTPQIIHFEKEQCPGPDPQKPHDTITPKLIICRIFLLPQQYTQSTSSVAQFPKSIIEKDSLLKGLIWHPSLIIVNATLLYGNDCGLNGHLGDVESFQFSLKHKSTDERLWHYDKDTGNWEGHLIQTISHSGTACEHIERNSFKNMKKQNGSYTIFSSPNKHGSYITVCKCNNSGICDPSCSGKQWVAKTKIINAGEYNHPLVTDLGKYYPFYSGDNPWAENNFLGGHIKSIRTKLETENYFMLMEQLSGKPLTEIEVRGKCK